MKEKNVFKVDIESVNFTIFHFGLNRKQVQQIDWLAENECNLM